MENKEKWLNVAEVFDAYRIIPRAILIAVLCFAGFYIYDISIWYMGLPAVERTGEVSAFAGVTIPALFGLAGKMIDWYLKTGRSWTIKKDDSE